MKKSELNKLKKALEMMKKAQDIVNQVSNSCSEFRYSSNANFRDSRIEAAVSILETEINQIPCL